MFLSVSPVVSSRRAYRSRPTGYVLVNRNGSGVCTLVVSPLSAKALLFLDNNMREGPWD
jgi:hypothetical protein